MSMLSRTKPICDLVELAREFYELGGACRVLRVLDISRSPYSKQYTLQVTKGGIEAPEADVIVHLRPRPGHGGEIAFLYLWDDKIWNASTNFDTWTDDTGIMVVTFMEEVKAAS